jgi:hypothetical protein
LLPRADISVDRHPAELGILLLLTVAGELVPITVTRHGQVHELTTSTTFSFAVMLSWGFAPALLAHAAGPLSADLLRRKPLWKTLFKRRESRPPRPGSYWPTPVATPLRATF